MLDDNDDDIDLISEVTTMGLKRHETHFTEASLFKTQRTYRTQKTGFTKLSEPNPVPEPLNEKESYKFSVSSESVLPQPKKSKKRKPK